MAALHNLTELLKNSRKLPSDDTVATALRSAPFTFIGSSSLVAVNAFAPVTHESHDMYEEMQQEAEARPSPASFAARVFLLGKQTSRTQTIVYNGISGSGKTYLAGAVTDCFCQMAQNSTKAHQLQALLAVMASMTQAKNTSSSPSASRCASLLELHFAPTTKQSDLLGGKILPFAFDKQRLLRYSGDERTFNVFYEMMAAASPRERQEWGLRDLPSDYALLNQTASSLSSYDEASEEARARDRKAFDMFRQALAVLQISPRAVSSIFRLLSAIMVLYNLTFDKSDDGHVQVAYDAQPDLEIAATLLNVQPDELEHLLLNKTRFVKKDLVSFLLDADGCNVQRNNFCQTLYTLLLVCLTDTANLTFALSDEELVSNQAAGGFGILQLDMPGFQGHTARWAGDRGSTLLQSIGTDGFEEFRTNYSQEMLQHWLMSRNFEETRGESALVASEGVSLPPVEIIDRSPGRMELLRGGEVPGRSRCLPLTCGRQTF
jgi:chitin synthase